MPPQGSQPGPAWFMQEQQRAAGACLPARPFPQLEERPERCVGGTALPARCYLMFSFLCFPGRLSVNQA